MVPTVNFTDLILLHSGLQTYLFDAPVSSKDPVTVLTTVLSDTDNLRFSGLNEYPHTGHRSVVSTP